MTTLRPNRYSVTLIQFHRELLDGLVRLVTVDDPHGAAIIRFGRHSVRRTPAFETHLPETVLPHPENLWMIVPASDIEPLPIRGEYQFARANSPERLDTFLAELSDRHPWTILPWGGFLSDESIAFITRDAALSRSVRKVTERQVHRWSTISQQLDAVLVDHLLTRRDVATSLLATAEIALVEEYRATGSRIWDKCAANEGGLYVCAGPPDWPIEYSCADGPEEDLGIFDAPLEITAETLATEGGLEVVGLVEENAVFYEGPRWLYRITQRETFLRFAARFRVVNGFAAQALPLALPEARIKSLLQRYLVDPSPTHIPQQLSLLQEVPWFWAAAECHMDVQYQHFATRDRDCLARFVTAPPDELGLISLF